MSASGRGGGPLSGAQCTICNDPQRAQIDAALQGGMAIRKTASTFSVKYDATRRHWMNHVVPTVQGANPNGWQPPAGASWRDKMEALATALETGKIRSDMAAQLRMAYKELDEADTGGPLELTVADVPGLAEMMGELFLALDPYPQAREAMGKVMRKHGFLQ